MMTRTEKLHKLMTKHDLKRQDVAEILNRSVMTVSMWRVGSPREIPENMLELLELKLAQRHA